MVELDDLRAKLRARRGRTGFAQNVAEIEARVAVLEEIEAGKRYRSKATGKFVSAAYAAAHPDETYWEGDAA